MVEKKKNLKEKERKQKGNLWVSFMILVGTKWTLSNENDKKIFISKKRKREIQSIKVSVSICVCVYLS